MKAHERSQVKQGLDTGCLHQQPISTFAGSRPYELCPSHRRPKAVQLHDTASSKQPSCKSFCKTCFILFKMTESGTRRATRPCKLTSGNVLGARVVQQENIVENQGPQKLEKKD